MDDRIILAHVADFSLGRLEVQPGTRTLVGDDGTVEIVEPRVMQVLVALAQARGAILTRDELTQRCWDGRIVGEDAINRVLSRLRRVAAGIGAASFRIETITKVGDRLTIVSGYAGAAPAGTPVPVSWSRRRTLRAGIVSIGVMGGLAWGGSHWVARAPPAAATALPADPETAALYLQAREQWAQRRGDSIDRAITGFGKVISRDPSYAPAYAGLADAYILAREFGSIDDRQAFARARAAADVALSLEPALVAAKRARGFVKYWWEHQPAAAGRLLRQAVALDPNDAQTHFWYGNMLADNGDFEPALAELDRARELNPESAAIQADWAWAQWSAGHRDAAVAALTALLRAAPDLASAHDALSAIYLSERNLPEYLRHFSAFASSRGNADLSAQAATQRDAYAGGGANALARAIERDAPARTAVLDDATWPAFVASSLGDRAALMAALTDIRRRHRCHGGAGQLRQISAHWRNDGAVRALADECRPQTMV